MRRWWLFLAGVPVLPLGLLLASPPVGAQPGAATITVEAVPSPAAATSAQPQLSASSRGVLLSWIERSGTRATLKLAERTAGGWSEVRTVASGDDWFVNWADVPSAMRLADGTLVAHWLQKSGADTYAYDVRLSYSRDEGQTWAPSFIPHTDGTRTEHGFASLFQMPGAGLGLVWLDGRATKSGGHAPGPGSGRPEHQSKDEGHGGGAMTVRFGSFDGAFKQTAESAVDLRVCECCPTAAAVTADGVIAAFRNRSDEEIRDIYVSRLENGAWSEPAPVHDDGWKIAACPVNGPALSARGRDVALAWFTVKNDQGQAYLAFSKDAGRTFGSPIRLDDAGSLGRVDVELLDDGSAVATWIEFASERAQFRARRIGRDGARAPAVTVSAIAGSRASGYPRLARQGRELVFAWTEAADGGALQVKTATARLP